MHESIDYRLSTGTGKTGKAWYMLTVTIGKYTSEPVFISELEYDYLNNLHKGDGKIELDKE